MTNEKKTKNDVTDAEALKKSINALIGQYNKIAERNSWIALELAEKGNDDNWCVSSWNSSHCEW